MTATHLGRRADTSPSLSPSKRRLGDGMVT